MRMPFGKHKGELISEIPVDYLVWVAGNCQGLSTALVWAIEQRLDRHDAGRTRTASQPTNLYADRAEQKRELQAKVQHWYRRLAMDFHPDRKGSNEAMSAINDAYDRLCKILNL